MRQIIQNLKTGETRLAELPAPVVLPGQVLIKTHRSLVSRGTEKMLVDFGKAGWVAKARSQPEKVRQVLDKMKTDGLRPTLEAVFRKLGEPLPLGYCNAGEVVAIGPGVRGLKIGDRVASNGPHAEFVSVAENLVAKIPDGVSYEQAAFTVIGAIALQGIRLVNPTLGETVVVSGLGLIGLITAQLLQANGCRVVGLDLDEHKLALAGEWGIDTINVGQVDPVARVQLLTGGVGADAVIIAASAKSDTIVSQAARMSRRRGRIVLVGVVGLNLQRSDFYEKELSFQVSCSYGPGRYQEEYEQKGLDYPIGYVRWTEKRNFQAVLRALATKQLRVVPLISEVVLLADYQQIYGDLDQGGRIASLLSYPADLEPDRSVKLNERSFTGGEGNIGIIGAGNYTRSTILPTLKKLNIPVSYLASARGLSSTSAGRKFGVSRSVTDYRLILADPTVTAVLITTRHHVHARQVIEALAAGKHVFVEKPLALKSAELVAIDAAYQKSERSLTVGFNRRFSPFAQTLQQSLGENPGPLNIVATMNAGHIPSESWVHDPAIGGGRIIGEACHLIDLATYLTGSSVESVVMNALGVSPESNTDNAIILLRYANGSQAAINYFANGSKAYPKERVEVYSQQRTAVIDNWRRLRLYGFKGRNKRGRQDKGQLEQFRRYMNFLKSGDSPPIPYAQIMNTSRAAIAAISSLQSGQWVRIRKSKGEPTS